MVTVTPPGECPLISSAVSSVQAVATSALAIASSNAVIAPTALLNTLPSTTTPIGFETGAASEIISFPSEK